MIERIVRSAAGGGAAGGGTAGACCASNGVAEVPRTVPTRSSAPARLKLFVFEITRPRLLCNGAAASGRHAPVRPAPTQLANQALKAIPKPKRTQIVDGQEHHQCKDDREAPSKRPIKRLCTDRASLNGLD